jgi:hypothetical protein
MLNARTDCGAIGDGKADDTAALLKFFAANETGYLPCGTYCVSQPLPVLYGYRKVFGDGKYRSLIKPKGDFSTLLDVSASVQYFSLEGVSLQTTHNQVSAVRLRATNKDGKWTYATVIRFSDVLFEGGLEGPLVYSNGQNVDFDRCTFNMVGGYTWGVEFDCFNQNSGVSDCRFGGSGQGVMTSNNLTPGYNRVEGLRIVNSYFQNTGPLNVDLTSCWTALIVGSLLDQAIYANLKIGKDTGGVMMSGCWCGLKAQTPKPDRNVVFHSEAGSRHSFSAVIFCNASYPILFDHYSTENGMKHFQVQLSACQQG